MVAGFTLSVLGESRVTLVHEETKQQCDDDISSHHYEAPFHLQHFKNNKYESRPNAKEAQRALAGLELL